MLRFQFGGSVLFDGLCAGARRFLWYNVPCQIGYWPALLGAALISQETESVGFAAIGRLPTSAKMSDGWT
jgi:hypothetical protein